MAAWKNLDTTIHCSFSLISSLGSQYSFLTSTIVGIMEVLKVFNNGLTGGKIFSVAAYEQPRTTAECLQIFVFFVSKMVSPSKGFKTYNNTVM